MRPTIPEWLAVRQLNGRMLALGVLPMGITTEDLIDILDEENEYEGVYSPDLLAMLDRVDQALIHFFNTDIFFYRDFFEPWYFDSLAPHIFDCKLPEQPPPIHQHREADGLNGGIFLILALVVTIGIIYYLLASTLDFDLNECLRHLLSFIT